jgi:hypothetical protein
LQNVPDQVLFQVSEVGRDRTIRRGSAVIDELSPIGDGKLVEILG